jgi:hypothetical protein
VRWVRRVSNWLRARGRRPGLQPPPPPDPARLEEAREAARTAHLQLRAARERTPDVQESAARSRKIHNRNSLGPAFMKALRNPGG